MINQVHIPQFQNIAGFIIVVSMIVVKMVKNKDGFITVATPCSSSVLISV